MSGFQDRAEQIGARLVAATVGAVAIKQPHGARLDYALEWADGHDGVLEVTVVAHPDAVGWQNQLANAGGSWQAPGKWELRLDELAMPYRLTQRAAMHAVQICDEHYVDTTSSLPSWVRDGEPDIRHIEEMGTLSRVVRGGDGIHVYVPPRGEFVDAFAADFAWTVERWAELPHVADHVAKTCAGNGERHLFLVVLDDVLPVRFFTDDFDAPTRFPDGFGGLDGLWVWSNFWHRFLGWHQGEWRWWTFSQQ